MGVNGTTLQIAFFKFDTHQFEIHWESEEWKLYTNFTTYSISSDEPGRSLWRDAGNPDSYVVFDANKLNSLKVIDISNILQFTLNAEYVITDQ